MKAEISSVDCCSKKVLIEKSENNTKPFICQYVVSSGGNEDSIGRCGLAHFIEHYLIHTLCKDIFPKTVKVHGFTSFYYTCFYWYVDSKEQGLRLFDIFDKAVMSVKQGHFDDELFQESKQEIIREIECNYEKDMDLRNIILYLGKEGQNIRLPIGYVDEVKRIESSDIEKYLSLQYNSVNVFKYIFDRDCCVYSDRDSFSKRVFIDLDVHHSIINDKHVSNTGNLSAVIVKEEPQNDFIHILLKNNFHISFLGVMLSEVFLMQVCEYLHRKLEIRNGISYENLFVGSEKFYFVITISKNNDFKIVPEKIEIDSIEVLKEIINPKGFKTVISNILDYLTNFNVNMISEKDIRMGLINYSIFLYPSIWLLRNREDAIEILRTLNYEYYYRYILNLYQELKEIKVLH